MKKIKLAVSISWMLILMSACGTMSAGSHDRTALTNNPALIPDSQYYELAEKNTSKRTVYDGLVNILDASGVLMTSSLTMAQVDHNARVFQYNDTQYQNEKGTAKSNLSKQTEVFLSLFVPDRKFDDLAKKSSRWKIFLDVAGQRYEAKVLKLKLEYGEVKSLYPSHTRWSTPYRLIFPVSTSISEASPIKLTLTGAMASTVLNFPPEDQ